MATVALNKITIGLNRRPLKDEKVAELMESIKTNGLLNPITLDPKLNLIAGLHRLTAYKLLGFNKIECNIVPYEDVEHVRLAEIDENLIRSELDALERSELWLERDQILERLGLRAKPGDNQYTCKAKAGEKISPPLKTTVELAKATGYTERTFQQGKQIAKSLAPEVKEAIRGTRIAGSPTALLKVARAGSQQLALAQQAEKAAQNAKRRQEQEEAQRQAKLAAEARGKQKELQLVALQSVAAQKEAKLITKKCLGGVQQQQTETAVCINQPASQLGDEWILARHLIYCDNTSSKEFIKRLPSDAALAIATLSSTWNHDYLVDEARVVAVLRSEGYVHEFCRHNRMPFRFELMLGDIYVAIFSHQLISKPQRPIEVEGVEGIVAYLVDLYTKPSNFVIDPFLGQGEVLITCEKMGRVCVAGQENLKLVNRALSRWQKLTGKQAKKMV